jgi:hypothetical protein
MRPSVPRQTFGMLRLRGFRLSVFCRSPKGLRFAPGRGLFDTIDTLRTGRANNQALMLVDMSGDSKTSIRNVRRGAAAPGSFDLLPPASSAQDRQGLSLPSTDSEYVVRALRPMQLLLERETADRRTLQAQSDELRARLAAAQLETAEARRDAEVQRAVATSAQAHVMDLRAQVEALRDALAEPPPHSWWWPFQ